MHVNPDGGLSEGDGLSLERWIGQSQWRCGGNVCVLGVGLSHRRSSKGRDSEGLIVASTAEAPGAGHTLLSNFISATIIMCQFWR